MNRQWMKLMGRRRIRQLDSYFSFSFSFSFSDRLTKDLRAWQLSLTSFSVYVWARQDCYLVRVAPQKQNGTVPFRETLVSGEDELEVHCLNQQVWAEYVMVDLNHHYLQLELPNAFHCYFLDMYSKMM